MTPLSKAELKKLLPLAIPVLIAQVAQMSMGLVDTIMAAHVSSTDMAAVSIGTSIWVPLSFFGGGLIMIFAPIIAHLNGAGKTNRISHHMNQGFWITVAYTIFLMLVLLIVRDHILKLITDDLALRTIASNYLFAMLWGAFPFLGYYALRSLNEGLSLTRPAMIVGIIGLLINIPCNYIFVNGKCGMPALGGAGCGVATTIVYWAMFLTLFLFILKSKKHQRKHTLHWPTLPHYHLLWTILKLGFPMAFASLCEIGFFSSISLLLAPLGVLQVASHQITLSISSMTFMIPLSLGIATSIRVAHNLGAQQYEAVLKVSKIGYIISFGFAVIAATIIYTGRYPLANFYTNPLDPNRPEILHLASILLTYCALYQISDAANITGTCILRGHKDTFSVFIISLIAYWVISLPVGYILGITSWCGAPLGAKGFWIGANIGLTISAIAQYARIRYIRRGWKNYTS